MYVCMYIYEEIELQTRALTPKGLAGLAIILEL